MKTKIIIVVAGGSIQSVFSNKTRQYVDLEIIDLDSQEEDQAEAIEARLGEVEADTSLKDLTEWDEKDSA